MDGIKTGSRSCPVTYCYEHYDELQVFLIVGYFFDHLGTYQDLNIDTAGDLSCDFKKPFE